jgi:Lrp/AsnC family transcriptional regulator for asnA, asnC and gidA
MYSIDETDRKILTILQEDARTPYSRISRMVNLSETAVRYRVSRLIKEGVIDRFTAMLNPRAVGCPLSAIVLVKVDPRRVKEAFDAIAALPAASHVIQTAGDYDLVVVIHAADNAELNRLATRIRGMECVREARVWMTTGLYKLDFRFKLL